jgi:PAS domain S-box-containing protein
LSGSSNVEAELRERLRRIEQVGGIAFWEWRIPEDRITWSRNTSALFGVDRAPTTYEEFIALVHPEDRARVRAEAEAYLAAGGPFEHEFRVLDRDGGVRWILDRGETTFAPDGRPLLMFGINIDLTAQRRTEAALRLSETRFRAAFDNAAVGIGMVAPDGRWLMVNDRMCEILGYARPELLALTWQALTHPDDLTADLVQVRRMLAGEIDTYSMEKRYLSKRRGIVWGSLTVGCVRKDDGAVDYFITVIQDMTERKRTEAALRESEQRLRLAQEVAAVGTFEWHIKDNVNRWSPEIERLYGLPEGAFGGTYEAWARCVHPDDLAAAEERIREALESGGFESEWRIIRPNGEIVWVQARAIVEKDAAGAPLRMIGANFDITERKQAEERQALLAREVDHRAKNALAVVQSVVRLTRADDPADFVAAVEGRIGAIAYAHTLLAESGWENASLRRLLERELAAYDPERVRLSGDDVVLSPDAVQPFALAIHELATNAVKYGALSSPSGHLEVTWQLDPAVGGVRLTWREKGGPPVRLPARHSFGSTLIATALEHQLGGAVRQRWHASGLVCELVIPMARVVGSAPSSGSAVQPRGEAARVMVVEDDLLIALDFEQTLQRLGYDVVGPVGHVAESLQIIEREPLDAVVLDANLGGQSARPVADRLRAVGIPFVVATGYGQGPEFSVGDGTPVLTKPVAGHDLRRALQTLLGRSATPASEPDGQARTARHASIGRRRR